MGKERQFIFRDQPYAVPVLMGFNGLLLSVSLFFTGKLWKDCWIWPGVAGLLVFVVLGSVVLKYVAIYQHDKFPRTTSIPLTDLEGLLWNASLAIHKVSNSLLDSNGYIDQESWKRQFELFSEHLIASLRSISSDKSAKFTTNVMLFVKKPEGVTEQEWNLGLLNASYTLLNNQLEAEYSPRSIGVGFDDIVGELITLTKSSGSEEKDLRIPLHKDRSKVLLGAPLVVDILKNQNPMTGDTFFYPGKGNLNRPNPDFYKLISAIYRNTEHLVDSDFRPSVTRKAKQRVRDYFKQSASIKSLISVGFTPLNNSPGEIELIVVLNINCDKKDPFDSDGEKEMLVEYLLSLYSLGISDWFAAFWGSFETVFKFALNSSETNDSGANHDQTNLGSNENRSQQGSSS